MTRQEIMLNEYRNRIEVADNVLSETRAKLTKAEHDRDRYKAEIERLNTIREMLGSQIKVLKQRLNDKYIEIDNLNRDYSNAFERLKSQQQEIDRLKAENEELTKVVSSKVYDLIDNANEIADAREAWEKQAKIDVLNELKTKAFDKDAFNGWAGSTFVVLVRDIDKLIEELIKNAEDKS